MEGHHWCVVIAIFYSSLFTFFRTESIASHAAISDFSHGLFIFLIIDRKIVHFNKLLSRDVDHPSFKSSKNYI